MSHDRGWRAACIVTILNPSFHSKKHEVARGVTAMVVGSGALLGIFFMRKEVIRLSQPPAKEHCHEHDLSEPR